MPVLGAEPAAAGGVVVVESEVGLTMLSLVVVKGTAVPTSLYSSTSTNRKNVVDGTPPGSSAVV